MQRISLSIFVLLIIAIPSVVAQKASPNTRYLIDSYNNKNTAVISKQFHIKQQNNVSYINAYLRLNEKPNFDSLISMGVQINQTIHGFTSARIPVSALERVSALSCVNYLQVGSKVRKRMDVARSVSNVDLVQAGTSLSGPYSGKGVVIGIIDNGFQYDHINFYTSDGTQTRIKKVWDQNVTGNAPTGFTYGTEYRTQAAIFAAKNDFTDQTHATHVTGIAAGSDKNNGNTYYGVAPDADLVLVSFNQSDNSTDNVSISDGISYIYQYADSVGKPCVVNLSLGSHYGPHDGTSAFDQVCDALQGSGKLLVGAAGNEGGDSLHISKTLGSTSDTLKTFMNYYDSTNLIGQADIWGEANKNFYFRVVVYNSSTKKMSYQGSFQSASASSSKSIKLSATTHGVGGTIYIYSERNSLNNKPNGLIYTELTSIKTGYYVGIQIMTTDGSTVHAWADDSYSCFTNNSVNGWTKGNSNNSMGEIGGTGNKIITVGAYTSKSKVTNINNTTLGAGQTYGQIATFSSYGPTIDGRMKPDITAPGTIIVSSFSSAVLSNSTYSDYFVKKNTVNSVDYYYGLMQGTSMSTPFVTGVLATWLGVKKDLTPAQIRTILQNTSITDGYTGTISAGGNQYWGWGKIDAWSGIKACVELATEVDNDYSTVSANIYPNPCTDYITVLFESSDNRVVIHIRNLNGQLVMSKNIGQVSAAQESTISLSNLPQGIYIVEVKGTKLEHIQRIIKK